MSEVKVNKISPRSGTAITLGDSGDTFTIPSGATLAIAGSVTGFTSAGIDDNATSVAITIDSSERVGIGTTSPSRTLHVLSSAGTAQIQSTGTSSTLYFADTNSSTIDNQGVGSIGNNMFLMAGGSERMRITSDGKVGIGTSSPSSDASSDNILEIAGSTSPGLVINDTGQASKYSLHAVSADFVMNYGSTAFFRYKPGDSQITAHDNLKIITGTSSGVTPASFAEKLFIDGIGNQGLTGTSSGVTPASFAEKLFIDGIGNQGLTIGTATSGIGTIAFGDSGDNDIGKIQYQHGDNSMLFVANAAERMRIDSSGNVGIKNTTMASFSNMPGTDLVVGGGTTHSGITIYSGTSSGSNIGFADGASGDARNQGIIQYHHNGDYMRFFTSASEKMRIDSSGNVGIGTSAPVVKLNVGDTTTGSAGSTGKTIISSQDFSTTYSGGSAATWSGLQLVNHDDTSNRTAIGVTFVHRSSSSGIAGIISTSASADRGDIRFITRGSNNTIAERMRIDDDGHVICPEGVTLGTAVGTYVAAKTLDDYETGTFTPTFTASTTNPTVTYANQNGEYVKIGDVVHFQIYFRVTETSAGSGNLKYQDYLLLVKMEILMEVCKLVFY